MTGSNIFTAINFEQFAAVLPDGPADMLAAVPANSGATDGPYPTFADALNEVVAALALLSASVPRLPLPCPGGNEASSANCTAMKRTVGEPSAVQPAFSSFPNLDPAILSSNLEPILSARWHAALSNPDGGLELTASGVNGNVAELPSCMPEPEWVGPSLPHLAQFEAPAGEAALPVWDRLWKLLPSPHGREPSVQGASVQGGVGLRTPQQLTAEQAVIFSAESEKIRQPAVRGQTVTTSVGPRSVWQLLTAGQAVAIFPELSNLPPPATAEQASLARIVPMRPQAGQDFSPRGAAITSEPTTWNSGLSSAVGAIEPFRVSPLSSRTLHGDEMRPSARSGSEFPVPIASGATQPPGVARPAPWLAVPSTPGGNSAADAMHPDPVVFTSVNVPHRAVEQAGPLMVRYHRADIHVAKMGESGVPLTFVERGALPMIDRIEPAAGRTNGEWHIHLHPPELGRIQVYLIETDQGMNARLIVPEGPGRDLIDSHVRLLRDRLLDLGVVLANDYGDGNKGQREWTGKHDNPEQGTGFALRNGDARLLHRDSIPVASPPGRIDIMA